MPLGNALSRRLEDPRMDRIAEVLRLQHVPHAVEHIVVREDRAKDLLLCLDVDHSAASQKRSAVSPAIERTRASIIPA